MINLFDAIVSNPPYSVNWIGADDPTLINDDRFAQQVFLLLNQKQILPLYMPKLSFK
jgi:N-6 DNA Methylase.